MCREDPGRSTCELTILLPCLNEAETVGSCVRKARQYLDVRRIDGEVLVADNGSSDGSQRLAADSGARVIQVAQRGYGSALRGGIAAARGRYVIMGDADDSYDFSDLDAFVEKLRSGYELVMGNRFQGGIKPGAMPWSHRFLGNPVLSFVGRLFYKSPIGDFHCGLRGFDRDALLGLDLCTSGMEFASEMVVKATLHGLRITEVPTTLSPDGRSESPHLRRWRDGWRHLRFLLLYSPRWLFLYPGALIALAGLVGMMWLLQGPQRVGAASFDVNTLVYCAAGIVVGFQMIVFALFAEVFAVDAGLLPSNPRLGRLKSVFSLELGLIVGFLLVTIGLLGTARALEFWGSASFGPLDPKVSLRMVVPAATAVTLGIQIASSGFFLSVLGLKEG